MHDNSKFLAIVRKLVWKTKKIFQGSIDSKPLVFGVFEPYISSCVIPNLKRRKLDRVITKCCDYYKLADLSLSKR